MWLMKTLLTSRCVNQRGAGQADWVQQNGELVIGGDWLTESGISDAGQLDFTASPGVIRLQWREDGALRV